MRTVREAVLDVLRARGMTTVFGNPGSTELPMLKDFPEDFRYVLGLQEAVVVGMADGFALASGTTALVNLHTGPGTGNAMGAILNARANRTPMVVTAGQQVRAMLTMEALLSNPQATLLPQPAVKWAYEPPRPADVAPALARAAQIAETPPHGPVFVSLPMDDMDAELTEAEDRGAQVAAARRVAHAAVPAPAVLAELAGRIAAARSAVLVVGDDVDASGAWDAVVDLADRTGLPVWAAPVSARVSFPYDHPQFRGELVPAIGPLSGQLMRPRPRRGHRRAGVPLLPLHPRCLPARGHRAPPAHPGRRGGGQGPRRRRRRGRPGPDRTGSRGALPGRSQVREPHEQVRFPEETEGVLTPSPRSPRSHRAPPRTPSGSTNPPPTCPGSTRPPASAAPAPTCSPRVAGSASARRQPSAPSSAPPTGP